MPLKGILSPICQHPEYRHNLEEFDHSGQDAAVTLRPGAKPAFLAGLWNQRQVPMLVMTPRPEDSRRLHDQLLTYLGDTEPVYLLPEPEVLPFERLAVDARTSNQRLAALAALARCQDLDPEADQSQKPPLVVVSIAAALRRTLPVSVLAGQTDQPGTLIMLKAGQRISRVSSLLEHWVTLGYRHEPVVEAPGTFSHRGPSATGAESSTYTRHIPSYHCE